MLAQGIEERRGGTRGLWFDSFVMQVFAFPKKVLPRSTKALYDELQRKRSPERTRFHTNIQIQFILNSCYKHDK